MGAQLVLKDKHSQIQNVLGAVTYLLDIQIHADDTVSWSKSSMMLDKVDLLN